jgi:hypothetical protein
MNAVIGEKQKCFLKKEKYEGWPDFLKLQVIFFKKIKIAIEKFKNQKKNLRKIKKQKNRMVTPINPISKLTEYFPGT